MQGGGAVSAAVMALAPVIPRGTSGQGSRLTSVSPSACRSHSMITGPVLNGWIGVPGIFWLTGLAPY
ncbi:MAG: hypothetical protein IPL59_26755 [Candidatus Competibacteraceae bacterium]|nr:hypothetical protein [Candidatus Competibacteraceae bacterium]